MVAWDVDLLTGETRTSSNAAAILGKGISDRREFVSLIHPDDRARVKALRDAAIRDAAEYNAEFRIRTDDGRELWVAVRGQIERDTGGRASRLVGIISDISVRKAAEDAAQAAAMRFRTAVDAVQGILWTNNAAGEMEGEQAGWAKLTGQTAEEYRGYGWAKAVHPDDAQATIAAWNIAVAERRAFAFEHRVRRHDGQWRHCSIHAIPMLDAEGSITEWVGVHTDITEQREAEAALREINLTLEERIRVASAERTEALERLHEAQKIETLGQLTGGVAHDFNNLLTPIMGGIDILSRKLAHDERAQRIAAGAMQSAERAKTLVQRLLSFGRRQTLQSRALDVAQLVEGMRDLIDRSIGPTVDLTVDIPADLPAVEADPNQLELAILNLCVNARDAMETGGRLVITAALVQPAGAAAAPDSVAIRVRDTGMGMDQATLGRATEPFFTTKGVGQGTGLGLSMVYGLAAQSGGKFTLASTVGEGTTAELVLPIATTPAEIRTSPEAPTIEPGEGTVLLVDDEELVRMSVADGLRDLGYKVVEAASAAGALEHLRQGLAPDVLVTDHMMPGMSGVTLASEARKTLPALPVLMITGYANLPPDQTRGLEVLAKPFQRGDLAARIAGLLKQTDAGNIVRLPAHPRPRAAD